MRRRVQLGIALIVGGAALLLVTTGTVSIGALLLPMVVIVVGVVLLARAFMPDGREGNVFAGTFLVLLGGFLLLRESALAAVEIGMIWPIFMTIGGLALVAYGLKKGPESRMNLVVPGIAIILLSVLFLLFSLDIITVSLATVVVRWWPVLFVGIGGLVLLGHGSDGHDT